MNAALVSGLDHCYWDHTIRVQDDLFGHVNGRWLTNHEIPADRATDGAFRALFDRAEQQVRDLLEEAMNSPGTPGSDRQYLGDLYASFLDEPTIDDRGPDPLLHELSSLERATTPSERAALLGALQRCNVKGPVGIYIDTDAKNSTRYVAHLWQSGLGLPDESYYRDPHHREILEAYPDHIARMFALVYHGRPEHYHDQAQRVLEIETALASYHWDVVKRRDADLTYNLFSLPQLHAHARGFDWDSWFAGLGIPSEGFEDVVVGQPDYLYHLGQLWEQFSSQQWNQWMAWQIIRSRSSLLPKEFVQESFRFYGTVLSGTQLLRARWKRAVSLVEDLLGDLVGKLYVQRYFPPEAKSRIDTLVENILKAYRVSIGNLEWMSAETRQKALEKLSQFSAKVGYPSSWRDYPGLVIDKHDLYGNYLRACQINTDREITKLHRPVDRDEWFMTPQTVNAYYNPGMNEIVFPAAILQPPFFDPHADDAVNYGGIGAVIGHEIGHGFDDQGSKYDGKGNLVDWWTDADRHEFHSRTQELIHQYDQYVPRALTSQDSSVHVNGAFTVGENIGDLGGLSIAILAYQLSLGEDSAPVIEGLTGLQRLFYGWAQVWREKSRHAEALQRLATDPHSPAEFRCNGVVRNIDAFYEAFHLCPTDRLYLAPSQRVHIWN